MLIFIVQADALRFFTNRCVRYSAILLGPADRFAQLTETDITVLRAVLDYWTMMDPRNPVSELSLLNIDCFARESENKRENAPSLTPDDTTEGSETSKEHNCTDTVDPTRVLREFPLSISSPVNEGEMEFSRWDWDSELDLA